MLPSTAINHRTFELGDSQRLFAQSWMASSETRGSIGIIHGLGEHSSRYHPLAERFVAAGYHVFAYDQRGHGRTEGRRGDAPSYDVLLDDVEVLIRAMTEADNSAPAFLFGQSFGGCLVLNFALRRQTSLAGIIASSPLLRPTHPPPRWKDNLGRMLQRVWPSFRLRTGVKAEGLSHDPAVVSAYKSDPLVHDLVSARLAVAMLDAGEWAVEHASALKTPTLLMHGTSDPITFADTSIEFAEGAGEICKLALFSGLYHELHREQESDRAFQTILEWLGRSSS